MKMKESSPSAPHQRNNKIDSRDYSSSSPTDSAFRRKFCHRFLPYSSSPEIPVIEVPHAVESFLDCLCHVTPALIPNKVQAILEYRAAIRQKKDPGFTPAKEDLALLFAMQGKNTFYTKLIIAAVFYRKLNLRSLDKQCADSCKNLLSDSFDTLLSSFVTAFTYYLLGCYYLLDNVVSKAAFYFNNVRSYIDHWNRLRHGNSPQDELEKIQMEYIDVILRSVAWSKLTDLSMLFKCVLYLACMVRRFHQVYTQLFDSNHTQACTDLDELNPYLGMIKKDIVESTDVHFPITLQLVDFALSKLQAPVLPTSDFDLFLLVKYKNCSSIVKGMKIQLLQKEGQNKSAIRMVADDISKNADSASLAMLHSGYELPILLATQVHLDCIKECTDPLDHSELLNQLKNDISLLQGLVQASKRLKIECSKFLSDLENRLIEEESRFSPLANEISQFIEDTLEEFFGADCKKTS